MVLQRGVQRFPVERLGEVAVCPGGVGKLPEIGGGMGKAIRNFKDASNKAETDEPDKLEENNKA